MTGWILKLPRPPKQWRFFFYRHGHFYTGYRSLLYRIGDWLYLKGGGE